jgi:hypothetical protein
VESDRPLAMLENAVSRTTEVLEALVNKTKTSVAGLLTPHAQVRGRVVAVPGAADVVIRWEDFVTDCVKMAG